MTLSDLQKSFPLLEISLPPISRTIQHRSPMPSLKRTEVMHEPLVLLIDRTEGQFKVICGHVSSQLFINSGNISITVENIDLFTMKH